MRVAQLFIPRPRPVDAMQIATRIFGSGKAECTGCGQCCKGTESIGVHKNEEMHDSFVASATSLGAMTTKTRDGTAVTFPDDRCGFLAEMNPADGGAKAQMCSIYAKRPWACGIFPFIFKDLATAEGAVRMVVALTASCPPVAELLTAGVNWLEPRECVTYEKRESGALEYYEASYNIPLLGKSLWPLIRFGNDGRSILALMSGKSEINGYFLKDAGGRSIIPIVEAPQFQSHAGPDF